LTHHLYQLDVPLCSAVGNLSYVNHFVMIISEKVSGKDRTWDFSPAKRIWDYFESFPIRLTTSEGTDIVTAFKPLLQSIEIRVVLEVVWFYREKMVSSVVEVIRRWRIQRRPLVSTVYIEPVSIARGTRTDSHLRYSTQHLQSGLESLFSQTYPELDRFVDVQWSHHGDAADYLTIQHMRRSAENQLNAK
jgi:hypothetical protein